MLTAMIDSINAVVPDGRELGRMLAGVMLAASKDRDRPNINSLHIELQRDAVVFVATDGHRLHKLEVKADVGIQADAEVVMDIGKDQATRLVRDLKSLTAGTQVTLSLGKQLDCTWEDERGPSGLTCCSTGESFPTWRKLLRDYADGRKHADRIGADCGYLSDAAKACKLLGMHLAVLTQGELNIITFKVESPEGATMTCGVMPARI